MSKQACTLRDKAIRLLAQREHSRAELVRKLSGVGSDEAIDALLTELQSLGLQSDQRFAHAWVRSKAARFGAPRIRHDLAQRGVDRALIDEAIAVELEQDEAGRARAIWASRFGVLPEDRQAWARQARFLQSRGFSTSAIVKVLREVADESA